jgi:hypothetical protein
MKRLILSKDLVHAGFEISLLPKGIDGLSGIKSAIRPFSSFSASLTSSWLS